MTNSERRGFTLHIHFRGQEYNSSNAELLRKRLEVYDPFQLKPHLPLHLVQATIAPFEGGFEAV